MKRIVFAVTLAACTGLAAAQDLAMNKAGPIAWACGGAGAEERGALAALRPQSNLELLFVSAKRGGYLADVALTVYEGDKPLLQVTAEGPLCELAAPAGKYRIEAVYGGVRRSLPASAGAKISRLVFGFPEEPWDGIKASDEEKRQARAE